ncbi:phosphoglycerate dehydrogenase-like oxidoreductase [Chthonomonas calidirosea]|uniref:D-2-hydroxyacid dehydrogenase n=1 Tax=Chthonomonas calidirosea TaxID=454171 RepID=UPI0006DD42F0|nr:D-2-hydroxyacid dehydrogenase [Chthonomonas calidirosea]CEK13194.1 phosphoglycerate dehydrogenase-like oxidoreductase [Chthonomonas calidirosea]
MSRTLIWIYLEPDDADAQAFWHALEPYSDIQKRIELVFGRTNVPESVVHEAEVFVCGGVPEDTLKRAERLRWVSFWSAGLDGKVPSWLLKRGVQITNASGVHGPNIAEHVLGMMIYFTRRFDFYLRAQWSRRWERTPPNRLPGELSGQTLGILGFGRIGEALAVRAHAFGMRVIAVKRDPNRRYDATVQPDRLYGLEGLPEVLSEADHVCVALPYTEQTHHLIDRERLSQMRSSAYLYNIARGKIVDEVALIEALQQGTIAGAGLDVFEEEPLPADSPLWTMENVFLTPHVSGVTPHYFVRFAQLFVANLERYLEGKSLLNRYEPQRGY